MRVDFHSEHIVDYYAVTVTQFFCSLSCSLLYLGSVRRVSAKKKILFYQRRMHEITISYIKSRSFFLVLFLDINEIVLRQ